MYLLSPRFGLAPQLVAQIFPFHLAFNQDMQIVQVGDVLQRICPKLCLGSQLEEHFSLNRPKIPFEFNAIQEQSSSLFLLECLHNVMQLKGQMICSPESEVMFFLCSPWVTNLAELKPLGLTLKDFAIHDPIADFLILLQTQNIALSDATKLTNKLTQQRTELREANRNLGAQYAVTRTLADSSTISEAIHKILAEICERFNWQIGAFWSVDKHATSLRCQEVWKTSPDQFTQFESLTRMLTFASGVGLPSRVWHGGQPVWIADIIKDDNFLRRPYAAEADLHAAFGFPIISGREVIGVLEFFSREIREPDDSLLEVMADVGMKIGQFFQRKQAEDALQQAKDQLRAVFDAVPGFVCWIGSDLRYLGVNQHLANTFNLPPDAFVGQELDFLENSPDFAKFMRQFMGSAEQAATQVIDTQIEGTTQNYLMAAQKYQQSSAAVAVGINITKRKQAEEQLKASLKEKEVLLKEIHHRVKNNLQIISSLLKLQSEYIKDDETLSLFADSYNRVRSMALIHEKLYQSSNLAKIDSTDYIGNLANNLFRSYRVSSSHIELKIQVDNILLDIDTAIPCGLIINELISNSLKYAFNGRLSGKIYIKFFQIEDKKLILIVSDNGNGLPPDFDIEETKSLGLQLVYNLTAQLGGDIEIDCSSGTSFKITFTR